MAVPNTTTFTLQNVVDEVNPTTDDLVDCFSDANADYFNPTYEGSKNSLLNFRDYGSHNAKVLTASPTTLTWGGWDVNVLKTVNITITPDATFAGTLSGPQALKFRIIGTDQGANTITLSNREENPGSVDYAAILTITASGYPDEIVTLIQHGQT